MARASKEQFFLRVLGGFEVFAPDGTRVEVGSRKAKALLAPLAIHQGHALSREWLATLLWGDSADEQARSSLRQALAVLKRKLGAPGTTPLESTRDSLLLSAKSVRVDVIEFIQACKAGRPRDALELYRGALLEGLSLREEAFSDWLEETRSGLAEKAFTAFEDALEASAGGERLSLARRLVSLFPKHEQAHRLLIRYLAESGHRDQAIRQYEACTKILEDDLGVKPEPATTELYENLIRGQGSAPERSVVAEFGDEDRDRLTTIAILPFDSLTSSSDCELLAAGLTEDLITELARYKHLRVIGNRISSHYAQKESDLSGLRRDMGIDFLMVGSLRVAGDQVRVSVQLLDAITSETAWSDRFDQKMTNILSLQDEIVEAVVARLAFNLDEAAVRQRQRDPTTESGAYTLFLRTRSAWREGNESKALELATRAVEAAPDYARAQVYLSYFYGYSLFSQIGGFSEEETMRRSRASLMRALALDGSDPFVLNRAAMIFLMLGEHEEAQRYAQAASEVSACDSEILVIRGLVRACCGRVEEGIALLEKGLRLERRLTPGCYAALSDARHIAQDYAGSNEALEKVTNPPYYVQLVKAANFGRLNQMEEAMRIVASAPPGFDTARFARGEARMCARLADAERWLESFRLIGVDV